MAIGSNDTSMTSLPKSVQINDLLLYDLPGFGDTRGTIDSLLNACFIKNIIENAKSSKLIFVVGMDQVTSERGKALKELLVKVGKFIPNHSIEDFSSLIMTKSDQQRDELSGFLRETIRTNSIPTLEFWMNNNKIDQMTKPERGQNGQTIEDGEKRNILELLERTSSKKIENVNVELVFDFREINTIKELYIKEIRDIFHNMKFVELSLEEEMEGFNAIQDQEILRLNRNMEKLKNYKEYFTGSFESELDFLLSKSDLINLLNPVSHTTYESTLAQMKKEFSSSIQMRISEIDKKIQLFDSNIKSITVRQLERELKDEKESNEIRKLEIQNAHTERMQQQAYSNQRMQRELDIQQQQLNIQQQQIEKEKKVDLLTGYAKLAIDLVPVFQLTTQVINRNNIDSNK